MSSSTKLLIAWGLALAARLAMSLAVQAPTVLGDEVDYFLAARRPEGHSGLLSLAYPPLYPALLTPWAALGDRETAYLACRVFNAIVSSTIVPLTFHLWIPAGLAAGCIVGLLAPGIITSGLILSENVFLPLTALWILATMRWTDHQSTRNAMWIGLAACAMALTRAAGAAAVIATVILMVMRRASRRSLAAAFMALTPLVAYLVLRSLHPPEPFNDPLRVAHPPEFTRALMPALGDLTSGTWLHPLAGVIPWAPLFAGLWFCYWCIQYGMYLVMGTAGLALALACRPVRSTPTAQRALLPLLLVTIVLVAVSANHNLAGAQAEQFIRGRYVEPLSPLWCALALGSLSMAGRCGIPAWLLVGWCLMGPVSLTAAQSRATALFYPLRSALLSARQMVRVAGGVTTGVGCFVGLRWLLGRGYRWAQPAAAVIVVLSLTAALARFRHQHTIASADSVVAQWLVTHDPTAPVAINTGGLALDSLKAAGLPWVVQQIRFFSTNPLLLDTGSPTYYRLDIGRHGLVCTPFTSPPRQVVCLVRGDIGG